MPFFERFQLSGAVQGWQTPEDLFALNNFLENHVNNWDKNHGWKILKQSVDNWWKDNLTREVTIYRDDNGCNKRIGIKKLMPVSLFSEGGEFGVLINTPFFSFDNTSVFIFAWVQKDDKGLFASFYPSDKDAVLYPRRCIINHNDKTNFVSALAYLCGVAYIDSSIIHNFMAKFSRNIKKQVEPFFHDTKLKTVIAVPGDNDITAGLDILLKVYPSESNSEEWHVDFAFGHSLLTRKSVECLPPLYRIVKTSAFNRQTPIVSERIDGVWKDLLEIANVDDWKGDYIESLKIFIELTFERLYLDQIEEKHEDSKRFPPFVPPLPCNTDGDFLVPDTTVFCTGLTSKKTGGYIYCQLSDKDKEDNRYCKVKWVTKDILSLNNDLSPYHHGLPLPASWAREANRLIFDYRYGSLGSGFIRIDYSHLFFDHIIRELTAPEDKRRFPVSVTNKYSSCDNLIPEGCIGQSRLPYVPPEFIKQIDCAWKETRKMLQANFKIAIPTYYRGKIQLLVPLYLEKPFSTEPTVALVVQKNNEDERIRYGGAYYWCPTCLTLQMARNNSRVITPLAGTWLHE